MNDRNRPAVALDFHNLSTLHNLVQDALAFIEMFSARRRKSAGQTPCASFTDAFPPGAGSLRGPSDLATTPKHPQGLGG